MARNPKRADGDGESVRTRVAFPLIQVHRKRKPVRGWDLQAMSDTTKLNDWCRTWQVIDWVGPAVLVLVLLQASTAGGLFHSSSWPAVLTTTEALCELNVSRDKLFPRMFNTTWHTPTSIVRIGCG
jgi:hypothetical protein